MPLIWSIIRPTGQPNASLRKYKHSHSHYERPAFDDILESTSAFGRAHLLGASWGSAGHLNTTNWVQILHLEVPEEGRR